MEQTKESGEERLKIFVTVLLCASAGMVGLNLRLNWSLVEIKYSIVFFFKMQMSYSRMNIHLGMENLRAFPYSCHLSKLFNNIDRPLFCCL